MQNARKEHNDLLRFVFPQVLVTVSFGCRLSACGRFFSEVTQNSFRRTKLDERAACAMHCYGDGTDNHAMRSSFNIQETMSGSPNPRITSAFAFAIGFQLREKRVCQNLRLKRSHQSPRLTFHQVAHYAHGSIRGRYQPTLSYQVTGIPISFQQGQAAIIPFQTMSQEKLAFLGQQFQIGDCSRCSLHGFTSPSVSVGAILETGSKRSFSSRANFSNTRG